MPAPAPIHSTRDRGEFRILLEENDDPKGRNQYFEVTHSVDGLIKPEIVFVRDSRVAYSNALERYGRTLLNVRNLETGRLVVGGRR